MIALGANQTTGYEWHNTHDNEVVYLLKSEYKSDEKASGLAGAGGTQYFYFKALKAGTTEINCTYKRTWESQLIDEKKFTVNVDQNKEGNMKTKEFSLSGFTRVDVSGAFNVEIIQGDTFSVSVTADDFPHTRVEVVRDTLRIGRQGIEWFAPFHGQPTARITMPALYGVAFSGASKGSIQNFVSTEDLTVKVSGASNLEARNVSAGNIEIEVSGASTLTGEIKGAGNAKIEATGASKLELSGMANGIDLEVNGASKVELSKFPVKNANIGISGASNSTVNLNGKLDANVSGASNLYWLGTPIMGDIQTSGASNLRRK